MLVSVKQIWSRRRVPSPILTVVVLIGLALVLEGAIRLGLVPSRVVARPSDAVAGMITLQQKVDFFGAFRLTLGLTGVALLLEMAVAIPLGYLLYRRPVLGAAYNGWIAALLAAPVFVFYPLFLVIAGRNSTTLLLMGFIPGILPMILYVEQAFKLVPRTLLNVGVSFGLSRRQIFWKIMVPAGAPNMCTGLRLGLMYTLINIVAIEYIADLGGLGRIVADRYLRFDIVGTYSAILAVALISASFDWSIGRFERWLRFA